VRACRASKERHGADNLVARPEQKVPADPSVGKAPHLAVAVRHTLVVLHGLRLHHAAAEKGHTQQLQRCKVPIAQRSRVGSVTLQLGQGKGKQLRMVTRHLHRDAETELFEIPRCRGPEVVGLSAWANAVIAKRQGSRRVGRTALVVTRPKEHHPKRKPDAMNC